MVDTLLAGIDGVLGSENNLVHQMVGDATQSDLIGAQGPILVDHGSPCNTSGAVSESMQLKKSRHAPYSPASPASAFPQTAPAEGWYDPDTDPEKNRASFRQSDAGSMILTLPCRDA